MLKPLMLLGLIHRWNFSGEQIGRNNYGAGAIIQKVFDAFTGGDYSSFAAGTV